MAGFSDIRGYEFETEFLKTISDLMAVTATSFHPKQTVYGFKTEYLAQNYQTLGGFNTTQRLWHPISSSYRVKENI